jgi:tetratricopeptide (TPR) repeat protein
MIMRTWFITIALLSAHLLCASPGHAQEGTGGTRSIFSIGAGSRAIGMGGAFVALGDDPSALYYNPAALRANRHFGVMLNHIQLYSGFSDANYDFVGLVYPTMSVGSIGLGFMTSGTGGIREFDEFSRELGEISYRESQAILAYGFDLPWDLLGRLSLGSSVKVLHQRVGEYSDTGTGLDFGLLYRSGYLEGFTIGANLQDIVGAETKLVAVSEKVDRTMMFGAGYSRRFGDVSMLNVTIQYDMPERDDNDVRVGAEYSYNDLLSVRIGFDSEQITGGIGIVWRGYGVDYGYFSRQEAGSSHPISLSARIGPSLEEKARLREERRALEYEQRIHQIFSERVSRHIQAAERYRSDGTLEQALDELKIAREYDPTNEEVARSFENVQLEILAQQAESTKESEKALLINQHFQLGLKYYGNNEYLLAKAEWRNVLDLDPENEGARDYLDRTDEKIVEQVAKHRQRAGVLEGRGELAAALSEWNLVRLLDPESAQAAAAIERLSGRVQEMQRSYQTASRRLEIVRLFESALIAFREGRYTEAKSTLEELLRADPSHEEAKNLLLRTERRITPLTDEEKEEIKRLYIAGMKYFTQGNYTAAIEEWRKILEIDPDNESVQKNIEEAQRRLERVNE